MTRDEHAQLHVELMVDADAWQWERAFAVNRPAAEQHLSVLPAAVDYAAIGPGLAAVNIEGRVIDPVVTG